MAAPCLTPQQQRKTVRTKSNKKKQVTKTVLKTPYNVTWPVLDPDIRNTIEPEIKQLFLEMDVGFCLIPSHLTGKQKKVDREIYIEKMKLDAVYQQKKKYRDQLSFGLNECTRALEKGNLRALIISRDINTRMAVMSQHLAMLCSVRECPAVCIPDLSQLLRSAVKVDSISAIGIKKTDLEQPETSPINTLVDLISKHAPPIQAAWLPNDKGPINSGLETDLTSMVIPVDGEAHDIVNKGPDGVCVKRGMAEDLKIEPETCVTATNENSGSNTENIIPSENQTEKLSETNGENSTNDREESVAACDSVTSLYILKTACLCHQHLGDSFISLKSVDEEEESEDEIVYTPTGIRRKRKLEAFHSGEMNKSSATKKNKSHQRKKAVKSEFVNMDIGKVNVSRKEKKAMKRKKRVS